MLHVLNDPKPFFVIYAHLFKELFNLFFYLYQYLQLLLTLDLTAFENNGPNPTPPSSQQSPSEQLHSSSDSVMVEQTPFSTTQGTLNYCVNSRQSTLTDHISFLLVN